MKPNPALDHIYHSSKWMLELPEDWDDDGAGRIKQNTLFDVMTFLNHIYIEGMPDPSVSPCPDGSIDMLWDEDNGNILLVNLDEGNEYVVSYWGMRDDKTIGGTAPITRPSEELKDWFKTYGEHREAHVPDDRLRE